MNYQLTKLPEKSWILYNVMLEGGAQRIYSAGGIYAVQYPGKPLWMYAEDGRGSLRFFYENIFGGLNGFNGLDGLDGNAGNAGNAGSVGNARNAGNARKVGKISGLITDKESAAACLWPAVAKWELAALYLPSSTAYDPRAHNPGAYDPRAHGPRAYDSRAHDSRAYDPRAYDPRAYDSRAHEPRAYDPRAHDSTAYNPRGKLVFPSESDTHTVAEWVKNFYQEALDAELGEKNAVKALIDGKKIHCLEAEGRNIVAMGMLIPLPHRLCRLNLIYVPPHQRGRGFGKDITSALAHKAQQLNQMPVLYVRTENKAAMNIYQSLGFIEAGRLMELKF